MYSPEFLLRSTLQLDRFISENDVHVKHMKTQNFGFDSVLPVMAPTVVLLSRIPKLAEAVHAASKGVIQTVALDPTSPDLEVLKSAEVVLGDPGIY